MIQEGKSPEWGLLPRPEALEDRRGMRLQEPEWTCVWVGEEGEQGERKGRAYDKEKGC